MIMYVNHTQFLQSKVHLRFQKKMFTEQDFKSHRSSAGAAPIAPEVETIWFLGGLAPAWAKTVARQFVQTVEPAECVLVTTAEQLPRR